MAARAARRPSPAGPGVIPRAILHHGDAPRFEYPHLRRGARGRISEPVGGRRRRLPRHREPHRSPRLSPLAPAGGNAARPYGIARRRARLELPLDDRIAARAIELRRQKMMSLADSIIAATALLHRLPLVTRNEADFTHVAGLENINPFALPGNA
jgi:hypothetical protein